MTMNTIRTKLSAAVLCTLGAAALGALAAPVQATEQDDPPTRTVRFGDLNLASPAGAKALYGRIRLAAHRVCEVTADSDPIQRVAVHTCIDKAIDDAVLHVNAPMLTALRFGGGEVRLASK
jgi:UrcA family protein